MMKPKKVAGRTRKPKKPNTLPTLDKYKDVEKIALKERKERTPEDTDVLLDIDMDVNSSSTSRRVTRSSTKSKVTGPVNITGDKTNSNDLPKRQPVYQDPEEELMSLDGSSSSCDSQSEDSDFLEVVPTKRSAKSSANNSKVVIKKSSIGMTNKNKIVKPKAVVAVKYQYKSDGSTSDDDFEDAASMPNSQTRYKQTKKPHESLRKLEDTSDEDENSNNENTTTAFVSSTNSSNSLFHANRPVDNTFSTKSNGIVSKSVPFLEETKESIAKKLEISKILAIGESSSRRISNENSEKSDSVNDKSNKDDSSDESSVGWEEVADGDVDLEDEKKAYHFPKEGVVVTLPNEGVPMFNRKKDKQESYISEWIRKEQNRNIKELQELIHKTNVLCLLARGIFVNNILRSEEILGSALSVLPSKQAYPPKHLNLSYLERFLTWFRATYKVKENMLAFNPKSQSFEDSLPIQLREQLCENEDTQVLLFNVILRSLGVDTRIVSSFQPLPLRPPHNSLIKPPKLEDSEKKVKSVAVKSTNSRKKSHPITKAKSLKADKPKDENGEKTQRGRKIISTDDESDQNEEPQLVKPLKKSRDFWTEVYLEEEERWVSVDITTAKVLCDNELEGNATQPLCYVVAFDNKGQVRDVTRRYASRWLTTTQKLRVDSTWWNATLKPFRGRRIARDREEDEFLDQQLMAQPLPKTIREYKDHPLFVLRQDLLKFEALYPLDPTPLGFVRKIPVFSRECVKILSTREIWSRKAKVVRMGETPYKIVKARPKYDRLSNQKIKDLPMQLFGEWQVEDFVPPVAKDGKVPRNDYGNVELFMEKMLPKGTVYLQLPALGRVAKKLDIDCAPALTGFEFQNNRAFPVFDGFVVCEEFKEILLDAWNHEQDEQKKRNEEKRLKRVYGNWTKLIRGSLIRRKLETKYSHTFSKRKLEESGNEPGTSAAAKKRQRK